MNRPKLSGAISGNHDLRYPYCAEILDTQAVLNDTHVECPISNGHSLRVIVLNPDEVRPTAIGQFETSQPPN